MNASELSPAQSQLVLGTIAVVIGILILFSRGKSLRRSHHSLYEDCRRVYAQANDNRKRYIAARNMQVRFDEPEYQRLVTLECGALMVLLHHFPHESERRKLELRILLDQIDSRVKLPPPHG